MSSDLILWIHISECIHSLIHIRLGFQNLYIWIHIHEFVYSWIHILILYMNSYILWIHMINSYMNSYVFMNIRIYIWIRMDYEIIWSFHVWIHMVYECKSSSVIPSAFPPGPIPPAGTVGSYPSRVRDKSHREERVVSKSFIVFLNCICILMTRRERWRILVLLILETAG